MNKQGVKTRLTKGESDQVSKNTKTKSKVTCPDCDGSKLDNMDSSMYCPFCDGKGKVKKSQLKGTIYENT